jgi:hypothetical protein
MNVTAPDCPISRRRGETDQAVLCVSDAVRGPTGADPRMLIGECFG